MLHHLWTGFSCSILSCQLSHSGSPCWQCYSTCCCRQCMEHRCLWFGHSSIYYPSSWGGNWFHPCIHCKGSVNMFLNGRWIPLDSRCLILKAINCEYAQDLSKYTHFKSLPLNFICMFFIALFRRSVCVLTTILRIPSHYFWVPLMFVCFMINPHIVFSSSLKWEWKSFW